MIVYPAMFTEKDQSPAPKAKPAAAKAASDSGKHYLAIERPWLAFR